MSLHTYSAKDFLITFGAVPITGYGDDTFLELEFDEDDFTEKAGSDGNVTRSHNANNMMTGTLSIMQTALSNGVLTAARNADKALPGSGVKAFFVKDLLGNDVVTGKAYVKKMPTITRGKEAEVHEWAIKVVDPVVVLAGSIENTVLP